MYLIPGMNQQWGLKLSYGQTLKAEFCSWYRQSYSVADSLV